MAERSRAETRRERRSRKTGGGAKKGRASGGRSDSRRGAGGGSRRGPGSDAGLVPALGRIPGWAPAAVYLLVTLALFREFVFSDAMLFGSDTLSLGYMARAFFAEALRTTGFPLWNPIILGGTPFLESLAGGDSLHPLSVALLMLMDTHRALGWKLVIHVFLAGLFMFAWLRMIGVSKGGAFVGGLAFLLAPYMVTLVFPGHDGKIFVTAMAPIVFWAAEWSLGRGGLLALAALAISVAIVILSTHFQMAYFLFGAVGAYMLFRCIRIGRAGAAHAGAAQRAASARGADVGAASQGGASAREPHGLVAGWGWPARRFGAFLLFSGIGAGVAAVQLVPAVDYVTEHSRRAATTLEAEGPAARDYAASWSLHPEEIASLVVPEFVGGSVGTAEWVSGTYWGRNPFKLNHEYLGLIVLLLGGLAFVGGRGGGAAAAAGRRPATESAGATAPHRTHRGVARRDTDPEGVPNGLSWFMLGMGLVALFFTLGAHTPVWRVFYEVIPGISLFRAPSMAIFLTGFAAATLAGLGIDRAAALVDAGEARPVIRYLGGAAAVLALGLVLAATGTLTSIWTTILYAGIEPPEMNALRRAESYIVRGFALAAVLAGLLALLWWSVARVHLPALLLVPALGVLVAADQWRVNAPFIETLEYAAFAAPDENIRFLLDRQGREDPFRVLSFEQGGQDVTPGMHGLELAGGHHPNDLWRYRELIGMEGSGLPEQLARFHPNVMPALNIRYILWPEAQYGPLEGLEPVSRVTLPDGRVRSAVYQVPTLPRARVVGEALVVSEAESLATVLDAEGFDPAGQVVLVEDPPTAPGGPNVTGEVEWIIREPDRLVFDVNATGPALVVVSENWFPAWRARVDGEETPVLRADHTLRAIAVPAGSHRVEMTYEAPLVRAGLAISLLSLVAVIGAAGTGLVLRRRTPSGPAARPGEP